jgi:hypothetical protein
MAPASIAVISVRIAPMTPKPICIMRMTSSNLLSTASNPRVHLPLLGHQRHLSSLLT